MRLAKAASLTFSFLFLINMNSQAQAGPPSVDDIVDEVSRLCAQVYECDLSPELPDLVGQVLETAQDVAQIVLKTLEDLQEFVDEYAPDPTDVLPEDDPLAEAAWNLQHRGVATLGDPPIMYDPGDILASTATPAGSSTECVAATVSLSWVNIFGGFLAGYTQTIEWCWTQTSATTYVSSYHGESRASVCCFWTYDGRDVLRDDNDTACAHYTTQGHFALRGGIGPFNLTLQEWHPYISQNGCVFGEYSHTWTA